MNQRQISPKLWQQVSVTLEDCAPFADARQLRDICADPRLKPWQQELPTSSQNFRDLIVAALALFAYKTSTNEDNVLILFLQVLAGRIDPGDGCHKRLSDLAKELMQELEETSNDELDAVPDVKLPLPDITVQVEVLTITLRSDGKNWQLLVTNTGTTKLRHVTLVLRPSPAVFVHPAQFKLGTIDPGVTVVASRLIIRPKPDSSSSWELPFKIDYLADTKRERQEAVFHIPITTSLTSVVKLELDINFHKFTLEEQNQFIVELSRIINTNPNDTCILHVVSDSVLITLEMPEEAGATLLSMFLTEDSELKSLPIRKVELIRDPQTRIQVNDQNKSVAVRVEAINLANLRHFTVNYFNETELRDICFDLSVDYESLPGQGKRDKARELVAYLERHREIERFVSQCCRKRPNIAVIDLVKQLTENTMI